MPTEAFRKKAAGLLRALYGTEAAASVLQGLEAVLAHGCGRSRPAPPLSERSVVLLAYPDQVRDGRKPPLAALDSFLARCEGLFERVQLLPFSPLTSEEPLSVIDPFAVDPRLGSWGELQALGSRFSLGHEVPAGWLSTASEWFRRHAARDPACAGFFLRCDPYADCSAAGASGEHPLLASHDTADGQAWFWSSGGGDTADLNYRDPSVLLTVLELLLFHAARGAGILQLRGCPYLWKTPGTPCAHLPEAHAVLRVLRAALDAACPDVLLASDSDSSPEDDFSYFGGGERECQLVRQRPLPMLAAYAVVSGDARPLAAWAAGIRPAGPGNAYLNLTASPEGLRMRHASAWLDEKKLHRLLLAAQGHGGQVLEGEADGEAVPRELHGAYLDLVTALGDPDAGAARKLLLTQAVALSLPGVPVVYFNSLFGSRNFRKGFAETGDPAALQREKPELEDLARALAEPASLRSRVFEGCRALLSARALEPAFHPCGPFRVPPAPPTVLAVERGPSGGEPCLLALHNVDSVAVRVPLKGTCLESRSGIRDLLSGAAFAAKEPVEVPPYGTLWLKAAA